MSDTPRTDAIETQTDAIENLDYIDRQDVWIAFARNLERELAAFRSDNLTAHKMACAAGIERDTLRDEIAIKDAEIERLRDLLRFAWADDDLAEFSKSARRAYIDEIRAELGMEAIK